MKTMQDYICQVFIAYRLMLDRYYDIVDIRTNNRNQTVKQFTIDSNMLYIAYDMIMRGEY
jgi:hypothetical protein